MAQPNPAQTCAYCGGLCGPQAQFCPNCGNFFDPKLAGAIPQPPAQPQNPQSPYPQYPQYQQPQLLHQYPRHRQAHYQPPYPMAGPAKTTGLGIAKIAAAGMGILILLVSAFFLVSRLLHPQSGIEGQWLCLTIESPIQTITFEAGGKGRTEGASGSGIFSWQGEPDRGITLSADSGDLRDLSGVAEWREGHSVSAIFSRDKESFVIHANGERLDFYRMH